MCLTVRDEVAGERIFKDTTRTSEHHYKSIQKSVAAAIERHQLEAKRFQKNYGLDIDNKDNFDLVIDTTHLSPEQVCQAILATLRTS